MKRACTDLTGSNRTKLNTQAGNDQDVRQDPDVGKSRSTQQPIPTVNVDNDRQTMARLTPSFSQQPELASQFASSASPSQLSASQPVLRGLEAAESAHGSGDGQTHAPGSLASQEPGSTSCARASMITGGLFQEQGSDAGTDQAALDKRYRSELIAWVESAAPTARALHREAQRRINAYLEKSAEQKKLIRLTAIKLSTLPPLPPDLIALDLGDTDLTALSEHLPQGLRELDLIYNLLTALPEHLPQGLQKLRVCDNNLTALPKRLPQGLQELNVSENKLTALPEHMPQGLQKLNVRNNKLIALPEHLPQGLQQLYAYGNKLTALPEHLPQGLQVLDVGFNKLTALPAHLPKNLKSLSVSGTRLDVKTLLALMRTNTSITKLNVDRLDIDIDAGSRQELDAELVNNIEHPARLLKAAATLDLLTRFGFTTSDQADTLIKRNPTPNPVPDQLPGQPIPAELHDVLAANCPKDVLAVLAGMADGGWHGPVSLLGRTRIVTSIQQPQR